MWAFEKTMYQIYPLGMCGAPFENDGVLTHRILRVLDFIPHLQKLGVGAVYFSPLFESDTHGYNTRDYRRIDVRLGTNDDFKEVCKTLHESGIKVILDGVFNHAGRGFFAFKDVCEKKWDSPYKDWFHISFDGNSNYNDGLWYEGWEGNYDLVKLNLRNPEVRSYLLDSVKFWIDEFGIDGLRLDVAYMVDRDFLKELRWNTDQWKPDFFLAGEILGGDYKTIMNPEMCHSATNYECFKGIFSSLNSHNLFEIVHSLLRQFGPEDWCLYRGQHLISFVDNHDVSRIASNLSDNRLLPLAYTLMFGMPGIPMVYYGSEWGVCGHKSDGDPGLRPEIEAPDWNELTSHVAGLSHAFNRSRALQYGAFKSLVLQNEYCVFEREVDGAPDGRVIVAVNMTENEVTCHFDARAGRGWDLVSGKEIDFGGGLKIPGLTGYIIGFDESLKDAVGSEGIDLKAESKESQMAFDNKKESIMKKPFITKEKAMEIKEKFPTPFHIYDEKGIRENARALYKAFSWNKGYKEYFAVKATPNPYLLEILKEEGCGADCSSYTELMLSKACDVVGENIMFSSNETPAEEFKFAKELGAIINLDDFTHISFLEETIGSIPETISCRYNPGGVYEVSNGIMDNPGDAKYGMTKDQIIEAYKILKSKGAKRLGIHAFLVSNVLSNDYYPALAGTLFELAAELKREHGIELSFINLSGGVGIPYRPTDTGNDIAVIGEGVRRKFEEILVPAGLSDVSIFTELGRFMMAPYGALVTTAVHEKHIYKEYIGVDACAANLMRPAMYGAYHHITVLGKEDAECTETYDVVGSLCENNDKFAIDRKLPRIDKGDILFIHDTGAHGFAMGYNYNGRLRSAELLLCEDGNVKMIRRAEEPKDYFATLDYKGL